MKSQKEAEAEVRSWGFSNVFTWTDGPNAREYLPTFDLGPEYIHRNGANILIFTKLGSRISCFATRHVHFIQVSHPLTSHLLPPISFLSFSWFFSSMRPSRKEK